MTFAADPYGLDVEPSSPPIGRLLIIAAAIIGTFVLLFTLWAVVAPISRAAIAPGELTIEGKRRVIQNLEGGIVAELAVKENDFVKAGQLLLRLDSTQTNAVVAAGMMERATLLAEDVRLEAERTGGAELTMPDELTEIADRPRIADIIRTQSNLFTARASTFNSRRDVFHQRIAQAKAEITGLQSQLKSERQQLRLLAEERDTVAELVELQFERKTRLMSINRQVAASEGNIGELISSIARARQQIAAANAELTTLEGEWMDNVIARQREVRDRLRQLEEELRADDDRNARRDIYAPVDGQVVKLRHRSPGAVVSPGEPILDIVPETDQLIVNAYLRPSDVENVTPGLRTTTHLVPYSGRRVPRLSGSVTSISQDALVMPDTGQSYYLMTVHIDDHDTLARYDLKLISGMPAEVFVDLGERSLFEYFSSPIRDSFFRAFRED